MPAPADAGLNLDDKVSIITNKQKHPFFAKVFLKIDCSEIMKFLTYYDNVMIYIDSF